MGKYVPYELTKENFLNNFHTRFPSERLQAHPEGLSRSVAKAYWNETYRNVLRDMLGQVDFTKYCTRRSDLYLDQTPGQFFEEVDRTVFEVGLSLGNIAKKINNGVDEELHDYIRPVYVALREKGYNQAELWT